MGKRVLLVFANPLSRIRRHLPYGLMVLKQALHEHDVEIVSPWHEYDEPFEEIARLVADRRPDIIGLGIRNIDTQVSTEWGRGNFTPEDGSFATTWFVPEIAELVRAIRRGLDGRDAPIIAGGGGFQTAPRALMERLDIEWGVVGPGEEPLRRFVERWPDREAVTRTPGLLHRVGGGFRETPRLYYEGEIRERIDLATIPKALRPSLASVPIGVRTRYGCDKACVYCLDPVIEGRRVGYRAVDDVIAQLSAYAEDDGIRRVFFTDPEFNVPDLEYATRLLGAIIESGLHRRFRFSSQLQPSPLTPQFAELMREAGFSDLCIAVDSLDADVIRRNGKKYDLAAIREGITSCLVAGVPILVDFIVGMVGDDADTLARTIDFVACHDLSPRAVKVNFMIGLRVYDRTPLGRWLAKRPDDFAGSVYGRSTFELLEPIYACFPKPPSAIAEDLAAAFRTQENVSFGVDYAARAAS